MKFGVLLLAGIIVPSSIFIFLLIKRNYLQSVMLLFSVFPILYQSRRAAYIVWGPFIITPITVAILLLVAYLAIERVRMNRNTVIFILMFFLYIFLLSLVSENPFYAIRGFQLIVLEPFLLYLIVTTAVLEHVKKYGVGNTISTIGFGIYLSLMIVVLLVCGEIAVSGGVSIYSLMTRQALLGEGGFTGGYEEPATLAIYLFMVLPLVLFFYPYCKRRRLAALLIVAALSLLILTFTRVALGVLLFDIIFMLFLIRIRMVYRVYALIILVTMVIISANIFEERSIQSEKYSSSSNVEVVGVSFEADGGLLRRLSSSTDALSLIGDAKTMVIGKGALSEITFWDELSSLTQSIINPLSSIGNGFLTLILYFGLVGFLIYMYFVVRIYSFPLRMRKIDYRYVYLALVPTNYLLHLLTAQGGFVAYGYLSHFPGWNDVELFYLSINEGIKFLPTNMYLMMIFFCLAIVASMRYLVVTVVFDLPDKTPIMTKN